MVLYNYDVYTYISSINIKKTLQTGLEINTQKTKSMRVNTATNTLIQIAEQNIDYVERLERLDMSLSL